MKWQAPGWIRDPATKIQERALTLTFGLHKTHSGVPTHMCMGAHTCIRHTTYRASRQRQQDIERMQALLQPHRTGSRGQPSLHLSCLGSELWRAGLNGLQVLKETILKQNILERGLQVVAPRLALHCFSPDSRLCHNPTASKPPASTVWVSVL